VGGEISTISTRKGFGGAFRELARNHAALAGLVFLGMLAIGAGAGRMVDPSQQNLDRTYEKPSLEHPLGTDDKGRDMAKRLMYGAGVSLLVGLVGTLIAVIVGTVYGLVSGYAGGMVDQFMMRVVDVFYALPYMIVVIVLVAMFTGTIWTLFIALGLVSWLTVARVTRGEVLSLKEQPFVEAAHALGAGHATIIFRHILPNIIPIVIVYTGLTIPTIMLQEAFLSFLGLTVQGQEHTWGRLLHEAMREINPVSINWHLVIFPSLAMGLTFLALNFLADGLGDVLDPRQRSR